jgi:formylglycine-generating enzyme required for sulfatase activity
VDWYDCLKWCNARSQLASLTPAYYTDAGLTQVFTNGEPTNVFANWAVNGYRLPTEAEWEKAARGGLSGQRFPWGNTISESQANYSGNPSLTYDFGPGGFNATAHTIAVADNNGNYPYTTPSGLFPPNGYGLYDMAGNVAEWCWDWYAGPTTAGSPYLGGNDPHGPASSPFQSRVERGGNFALFASVARSAYRGADLPSDGTPFFNTLAGFRCVRAH